MDGGAGKGRERWEGGREEDLGSHLLQRVRSHLEPLQGQGTEARIMALPVAMGGEPVCV